MLNPNEELEFAQLRALCVKLKVPAPPEIMIGLKVYDKDGVLIFSDDVRAHSLTRNFWNAMFSWTSWCCGNGGNNFGAGYMTAKTQTGTIRYGTANAVCPIPYGAILGNGFCNNEANAAFGILVGTDDTEFSADQYALIALISHGNGASQFSYQPMVAPVPSYNGGTTTWKNTIVRIFNNNSGGSITVKEIGLCFWADLFSQNVGTGHLFERTALVSPWVPVSNGAQLTITYEISQDFSAID